MRDGSLKQGTIPLQRKVNPPSLKLFQRGRLKKLRLRPDPQQGTPPTKER